MPCTFQLEIDELSPQARDTYHQTLRNLHDYGPPPDDHHCFGAQQHHSRYNWEDAERFQAYTKALDLRFEESDSQGATRGTVRTAPEVDTVQGHYGIYRIIDQVPHARIAQACHPGLRDMEFIEIDISDELYFGDLVAVKTLAFNPGYFPRPSGSSVLPYHRTTATLPGDHCRWSAKEYLVFRRHIRTSQGLLRVDDRVGVIEGFSGLTRLPSSFHTGRVYLGDVFYPEHLNIRGLTPILTHLPTILRHWKSRCAVPESLRALADSADLQNTRFDHRMFQHRVKISRDDELTVNCSADWLVGSRVLVGFLDREIEAVLVKSCNGYLTFQLSERYTGPPWVPVMVQQLGFQGEPLGNRGRSRRSSGSEEHRGDQRAPWERPQSRKGFEGYRGDRRSPSEERPLVGVYDPEPNRGSPDFEERYGRDEGQRREPEGNWDGQGQWDGPPGQVPRDSRQGYRPGSPEGNWDPQGRWDSQPSQDPRDSRQGYRPSSPEQQNWSSGPCQWNRNESPRDYQPGSQFRQAQESFGPQDAGFRRPPSEQYQNDRQQPSEYRNQHQQFSEPQFSPQGGQYYRSQPEDRPNDSQYPSSQSGHLQDRSLNHNPLEGRYNDSPCSSDQRSLTLEQYNAQNYQNYQRERGQSYGNEDPYPSDQSGRFHPRNSPQNSQYYRNQPDDRRSYVSGSQYQPSQPGQYPSDRPRSPNPQFSPHSAQFYCSQPGDRPKASQYPSSPQRPYDYPVIQTEQPDLRQDTQCPQWYRNQPHDRPENAFRDPSDQPVHPNPQFSPQGAQPHRSQPDYRYSSDNEPQYLSENRSQPQHSLFSPQGAQYPSNQQGRPQDRFETPILTQNRPSYRNQPGDRQYDSQYPSEHSNQPQKHFQPQFDPRSSQPDRNQSYGRSANAPQHPLGQSGPSNPQNDPQYHRNQSEDRQTLPRSLSPRVSTLSPSGDPIIRHSQSRSSVSQASSVSGDHFEQPSQWSGAPRASYPPSCSGGQGYASPAGYPVRNPLSYHSNQVQGLQQLPNQLPSTSRAAGYSDGLSPTGQSYYQGYATSSDGSEEDDSSSESEPEAPQLVQKRGYNALYSHFPSSSGREASDSYSPRVPSQLASSDDHQEGAPSPSTPREPGQPAPISTSESVEPAEPAEPPKPVRAQTPPFDPHNSRSWRHEHKDDICEVLEPKEPVSQGQEGFRASQQPSKPVRKSPEPSEAGNRSSMVYRTSQGSQGPSQSVKDQRDQEPSQSNRSSVDHGLSRASQGPSQPVKDHWDPQTSSRSSMDPRGSQASYHPVQDSWPAKDHQDSKPSRSSPDRKASTASYYSADLKWPSEPENSAPEEDQHPENHTYNAPLPESSSPTVDTAQDHPYLSALLEHQVLVIDALDAELHIASAAATLAKTDWNLKSRGLKQRSTQVIVCKVSDAPRLTGLLLGALEASEASGLRLMRFTGEHLLRIDFERCLARKLRGILREPGAWDQRIVLQAARYLTQDPLTPKLENLLRNNSHIPEMSMEEWVAWYMERWVPDVLLSTSEYLEIGTKYLRRVESVQVLGEVSEEHGELTARFPKAKIAVIGDVLGEAGGNLNPEIVEILKEAFSGLRGSQLISLRAEAPSLRPPGPDYIKIRSGIFPNPNFPILLIHNTSTKGTKEERNLQERKALDQLVEGLLGLENEFSIPPEDLQIICIEKNQVRDLRAISTPGIRIRSRQEAAEGVQGVLTYPEGPPGLREDDSAPQDHPQTTPIAIICCSNYKKAAFELIRTQLPQLLSYGIQATIFIGNIDEMEEAEGWGVLVTRCEEVGCSYSYQMVPEERSRRYQPTKRDHMGFLGALPEIWGSSSEFGGFESPKSGFGGSGSPRSVTTGSSEPPRSEPAKSEPTDTEQVNCEQETEEPDPSKPKPEESEPSKTEFEACEPKFEEPEPPEPSHEEPEPSKSELEACEPEPEKSEQTEPEHKNSEPKLEESEPSEPRSQKTEVTEPKTEESEPSEPKPEEFEPSKPELEACVPKPEEPEPSETEPEEPESFESEHKVSEPKSGEPEPPKLEIEACEPKPEEPEQSEPNPEEPEPCEPKSEESELSEPKPEEPKPFECKPEPSGSELKAREPDSEEPELKTPILPQNPPKASISEPTSPTLALEHLDLAITATVSPTLSPAIPGKPCSQTPEKDFTTPDCLLENLTVEDLEPFDQEYEDCEEEFQDAQEAENQDSDTGTYESTYSEGCTGPEESQSLEKFQEKHLVGQLPLPKLPMFDLPMLSIQLACNSSYPIDPSTNISNYRRPVYTSTSAISTVFPMCRAQTVLAKKISLFGGILDLHYFPLSFSIWSTGFTYYYFFWLLFVNGYYHINCLGLGPTCYHTSGFTF